jgi:hypothetical protein
MVPEAMRAARILKSDFGYETRVLNLHTLKPIDKKPSFALRAKPASWSPQKSIRLALWHGASAASSLPANGSRHSHLHPRHRPGARLSAPLQPARERHHHRHRRRWPARVVAGAVFTLPALYILKLDPIRSNHLHLSGRRMSRRFFLIPLRRYFVRDMHGQFPFPEATAITEVLVTGEKGGSQAKLLLQATCHRRRLRLLRHHLSRLEGIPQFQFIPPMRTLADRGRMVFSFDAIGFILGLGYVMGLRSSMILCAGGVLSNLVLVPLIWLIGSHVNHRGVSRRHPHRRR